MRSERFRPLIRGGIVVAAFLVLRLILPRLLPPVAGEAAAFLTVFLAILLAFIFLAAFSASELGGKISQRLYRWIEGATIAGILLGIVGMFQPWTMLGYRIGFHLLVVSTLAFTLWSHVSPTVGAEIETVSVQEYVGD